LCALVLALALPALAQTQPPLEPLVPGKPSQQQLPPIEPLSRPGRGSALVGVLVLGALPDGVSSQVVQGLRAVLKARAVRQGTPWSWTRPTLHERGVLDPGRGGGERGPGDRRRVPGRRAADEGGERQDPQAARQAQRDRVSPNPEEATAWAEALACQLLVPAGCTGQVVVDAPEGVELSLDGLPLRSGQSRMVPVGVHTLRIKEGDALSSRPLPVLHERTNSLALGPPPAAPPAPPPVAAPAAAVAAAPAAEPRRTWTRTAGYVTAGAAVAAARPASTSGRRADRTSTPPSPPTATMAAPTSRAT